MASGLESTVDGWTLVLAGQQLSQQGGENLLGDDGKVLTFALALLLPGREDLLPPMPLHRAEDETSSGCKMCVEFSGRKL